MGIQSLVFNNFGTEKNGVGHAFPPLSDENKEIVCFVCVENCGLEDA
jgi:hypothetical protein